LICISTMIMLMSSTRA